MPDSDVPWYDPDYYVNDRMIEMDMEENIGEFVDLGQDEIAAARLAEPDTDGFAELSQIGVDEARRATRLDSLFDISAAAASATAARLDDALDTMNSVSETLADKALFFADAVSCAINGYGIFDGKETNEQLLAEFESEFEDDGWA